MISMFKRGETKVPLEKIPALARALRVDPGHLFRLALEQYWPDRGEVIEQIFGNTVSANEYEIVREIRALSDNADPSMTPALRSALKGSFEK